MKLRIVLALLIGTLFCTGCVEIQTPAIRGTLTRVANSHDAYVKADTSLSAATVSSDLADTAFLRSQLSQPQIAASTIATPLTAVCNREDAYVNADTTLPAYKKDADLRDTALLHNALTAGTPTTAP